MSRVRTALCEKELRDPGSGQPSSVVGMSRVHVGLLHVHASVCCISVVACVARSRSRVFGFARQLLKCRNDKEPKGPPPARPPEAKTSSDGTGYCAIKEPKPESVVMGINT